MADRKQPTPAPGEPGYAGPDQIKPAPPPAPPRPRYGAIEPVTLDVDLRDYFAAAAVMGLLVAHWIPSGPSMRPNEIASTCYEIADAMLAEREKERP